MVIYEGPTPLTPTLLLESGRDREQLFLLLEIGGVFN